MKYGAQMGFPGGSLLRRGQESGCLCAFYSMPKGGIARRSRSGCCLVSPWRPLARVLLCREGRNGGACDFDCDSCLRTMAIWASYRYDGRGRRVQSAAMDGGETAIQVRMRNDGHLQSARRRVPFEHEKRGRQRLRHCSPDTGLPGGRL